MTIKGVDYAYGRPSPAALRAAGYRFACRYVSYDGNPKNLTVAEARALRQAGLDVVVVFERDADRPIEGAAAGAEDGASAKRQADALGAPPGSAIYAAVDFDPTSAQMPVVLAYLKAFARACDPHPCGAYGGYRVIDAAKGIVRYLWQAGAWSTWLNPATGRREYRLHPAAHLRQYAGTVQVDGVSCDVNDALQPDYGGWALLPPKEDDVTPEDHKAIAKEVVAQLEVPLERLAQWVSGKSNEAYSPTTLSGAERPLKRSEVQAMVTALGERIDALSPQQAGTGGVPDGTYRVTRVGD